MERSSGFRGKQQDFKVKIKGSDIKKAIEGL